MSETTEEQLPAVKGENKSAEIINTPNFNSKELAKSLATKEQSIEITGEYLDLGEGEQENLYVIGIGWMDPMEGVTQDSLDKEEQERNKIKTIRFLDGDENVYVTAATVVKSTLLVYAEAVEKGSMQPFAVSITCTGEKSSGKRTYKTYKIHKLV